jgi:allantoicase
MTAMSDAPDDPAGPGFTALPDLASRALSGSVMAANDELFAQRENLIKPEPSVFSPEEFGHKGKVYDGWETRRRRDDGHDWAIVRLGVPGTVHGVVVDTAWFTGNYPPYVSVEAIAVDDYPTADELLERSWTALVERSPAFGDTANMYSVADRSVWTHVRLSIYPDGGVARLRVHGEPAPDPRFLGGTIDLAALENGGRLVDCSDAFYSSPSNLILPGRAQMMGHGWENARRRDGGNDFALFALAAEGVIEHFELDTSYFVGNAPGWMRVQACRSEAGDDQGAPVDSDWWDVVPRLRTLPDTRHRLLCADNRPATHVRLDVYPDGGLARMRVHGSLTEAGIAAVERRHRPVRG